MKRAITSIIRAAVALTFVGLMISWAYAQDDSNQKSDDPVNISGTVIVHSSQQGMSSDTSGTMSGESSEYYLDEDGDGQADYQLHFSEDGDITKPDDGESVMVTGTMSGDSQSGVPIIQVSDIQKQGSSKSGKGY